LPSQEAAEVIGSLQDGFVTSNVRHGRQRIENLGSRDAWDHVHGKCSSLARCDTIDSWLILHWVEHGDDCGALSDSIHFAIISIDAEGSDLEQDVTFSEDAPAIYRLSASLFILFVGKSSSGASSTFNQDARKAFLK
jgi:hypothetical protein